MSGVLALVLTPAGAQHERLLAGIEERARGRGLPYLSLMVTEDNTAARGLYAASGFITERRMMSKAL